MKFIYLLCFTFLICSCANTYEVSNKTSRLQYHYDAGITGSVVKGLTVGMSPRRVAEQFKLNNWEYTSISSITLEDMVERGIRSGNFYISTDGNQISDLEVFFQDARVIFIRENYSILSNQLGSSLSLARVRLKKLGNISESHTDESQKIIYQPHELSYVYYKFYKLVKKQKGYNVSFVVANVKS